MPATLAAVLVDRMINHFRTYLLNQSSESFTGSLFSFYVDPAFTPSPHTKITDKVDKLLFGAAADSSLRAYRYFEFLQIIRACSLYKHVRRFDARETYQRKDYRFLFSMPLVSTITPGSGISLSFLPDDVGGHDLPMCTSVLISTLDSEIKALLPFSLKDIPVKVIAPGEVVIPSVGIGIRGLQQGKEYVLDARNAPRRKISDIVDAVLGLPATDYFDLFTPLRENFPEYEEGFRHVTDTLHKFCMILFAQAISLYLKKNPDAS